METMEMTEKEQMQRNVKEFARSQDHMSVCEKDSGPELKVIFTVFGINLNEIDYIKE